MYRWEIVQAVTAQRVFGIVRTGTAQEAFNAAEDVLDAVEVALTTPRALTAVTRLVEGRPEALVGAGTVLDGADAGAAVEAGARCRHCTEMVRALEEGADALKLFPASTFGPSWLRDVRAALPQAPVIPTGGATLGDAPEWITAGAVACGLGSALTGTQAASRRVSALLEQLAVTRRPG